MKRILLVLLLGLSIGFAQMSPRQLTLELLKDLQGAIADSTNVPEERLTMEFVASNDASRYLALIWKEYASVLPAQDSLPSMVQIEVQDLALSVNHDPGESPRNKDHIRRLDLETRFIHEGQDYHWSGSTSDRLDKTGVKKTVENYFPVEIYGDYRTGEAGSIRLIFTTLSLFTVLAALYFIRT